MNIRKCNGNQRGNIKIICGTRHYLTWVKVWYSGPTFLPSPKFFLLLTPALIVIPIYMFLWLNVEFLLIDFASVADLVSNTVCVEYLLAAVYFMFNAFLWVWLQSSLQSFPLILLIRRNSEFSWPLCSQILSLTPSIVVCDLDSELLYQCINIHILGYLSWKHTFLQKQLLGMFLQNHNCCTSWNGICICNKWALLMVV